MSHSLIMFNTFCIISALQSKETDLNGIELSTGLLRPVNTMTVHHLMLQMLWFPNLDLSLDCDCNLDCGWDSCVSLRLEKLTQLEHLDPATKSTS